MSGLAVKQPYLERAGGVGQLRGARCGVDIDENYSRLFLGSKKPAMYAGIFIEEWLCDLNFQFFA